MSYREVMSLPIRAFWLMNSCVGRLLAEKDLRSLVVQQGRHGGELMTEIREHLTVEMGDVGKLEINDPRNAERDQAGFDELKTLSAMM